MNKKRWIVLGLVAVLALVSAVAQDSRQAVPALAQEAGIELAVYNQNLALVKDRRSLDLSEGLNQVQFSDVASQIDPTSVHFRSLTDPQGTSVLEQNYEYDLVGSSKLLVKYLDQEISLVTEDGTFYSGTLLSGEGDLIIQETTTTGTPGRVTVIKLDQVREFSFPALPEGLITKPTLVWDLAADTGGQHDVEVTYLTGGVNWKADYIVVLADDEATVDLDGWVTLDNRSGATYPDAKLKLIAGDIHRAAEEGVAYDAMLERAMPAAEAPPVEERAFFEYHLYEVTRPVTVKDNQTKQVEFVAAKDIPVEKFFVYDGAQVSWWGGYSPVQEPSYGTQSNVKVMVMLEFLNGEEQNLGVPLPRGTVRVYKNDVDGSSLLIGEDAIDHTPKDESVRLYIGDAFDIVGERVQTDFRAEYDEDWMEESYEITLRNHKDEAVEVRVVEHLFRWSEWQILDASQDFEKMDARTIEFRVQVPADGEVTVTYTARYEW
jgi:hypothetical protein